MHEYLNASSVDDETLDKEVTCKGGNVLATICVRVFDIQAKETHENCKYLLNDLRPRYKKSGFLKSV